MTFSVPPCLRAAIEVHRALGPGLLESVYSRCLAVELQHAGLTFETEVVVPLTYRGVSLPALRADLLVERALLVEVKSVDHLGAVHLAQTLTYLKLMGLQNTEPRRTHGGRSNGVVRF